MCPPLGVSLQAFIIDSLGERFWVDHEENKLFVNNLRTMFGAVPNDGKATPTSDPSKPKTATSAMEVDPKAGELACDPLPSSHQHHAVEPFGCFVSPFLVRNLNLTIGTGYCCRGSGGRRGLGRDRRRLAGQRGRAS